jgi:hypothetical protein
MQEVVLKEQTFLSYNCMKVNGQLNALATLTQYSVPQYPSGSRLGRPRSGFYALETGNSVAYLSIQCLGVYVVTCLKLIYV